MTEMTVDREMLKRLRADLNAAAKTMSADEVRYLVDLYYQIQDFRIQAGNMKRSSAIGVCPDCEGEVPFRRHKKTGKVQVSNHPDPEHEMPEDSDEDPPSCPGVGSAPERIVSEPNDLVTWVLDEFEGIEDVIRRAMGTWSQLSPVGRWAESIRGIGPVISAGLLAHVDMERSPTSGHLMSFAGLNPNAKWEKKTKRPWNAKLKVLAWKAGESFVKVQRFEDDIYGKIYKARKLVEADRNERLLFKDQAELALKEKDFGKDTTAKRCYEQGKLPPARIHLRATRVARKMFLSHWWSVAFFVKFGKLGPAPYALTLCGCGHRAEVHGPQGCTRCVDEKKGTCAKFAGGHGHVVAIPNVSEVPGLAEALRAENRTA